MLLYLHCENEDNLNMPSFLVLMVKLNHLILIDVKYKSDLNFFSNCSTVCLLLCLLELLASCGMSESKVDVFIPLQIGEGGWGGGMH